MIRFNHMEITVPRGFVAAEGDNLVRFLEDVFGFLPSVFPGLDVPYIVMKTDPDATQFLFIPEHDALMQRASDDHLGFHLDSAAAVETLLKKCEDWRGQDPRVEIRDIGILHLEQTATRAIYVRYLLPIWFDIQNIAAKPGFPPARAWQFLPVSV